MRVFNTLFIVLVMIAGVWLWKAINNKDAFPIKSIEVNSRYEHIDRESLQAVVEPYLNSSFFRIDIPAIKKQLLNDPWIDSVTIRRSWPNKLEIIIKEEVPVATWNNDALLNDHSEIFTPPKETFPGKQIICAHTF